MTTYLCALCGATTKRAAFINGSGVPFCYRGPNPSCFAEASVRHEVTAIRAALAGVAHTEPEDTP